MGVVAAPFKLLPMISFSRVIAMAVLMAITATLAEATCNSNLRVAFDCKCIVREKLCSKETKDVCSWADDKCIQKPCNEIDDQDTCGEVEDRCKWSAANKCELIA